MKVGYAEQLGAAAERVKVECVLQRDGASLQLDEPHAQFAADLEALADGARDLLAEVARLESERDNIEQQAQAAYRIFKSELAEAIRVLAPNMPESGLVDACRQVKQAAISEADNSRKLEAEVARLREERIKLAKAVRRLPRYSKNTAGEMSCFPHGDYLAREEVLGIFAEYGN